MESNEESGDQQEKSARTAAQRRAEIRRRKLLLNSEDRMKKIVGFNSNDTPAVEPRFHLDLDRNEPWSSSSSSSKRLSPLVTETGVSNSDASVINDSSDAAGDDEVSRGGLRQRPHGEAPGDERSRSPRRGLRKYMCRFDDAVKLRGQLANEKAAQDGGDDVDELDSFRLFRLVGSVTLAVFVRVFVCQYLSIFAPFLTLELGYMGLHKYFPKVERKSKTTMLTAALLLSGIPAEVINRSMDTYRKMSDVFSDLCVYFFTFILSHEILLLFGYEISS